MNILAELHDLDAAGGDIGVATHQVEQADAGVTGKALVDHFQGRHPAPNDAVLTGKVVGLYTGIISLFIGINVTVIHPVEEGIDFIL